MGPDHIIGRLKAIRDPRMRVLALHEAFAEGEPEAWAEALAAMVTRAQLVDDADTQAALETVRQAAADPSLPYATRQALYQAAAMRGHATIARLFLASSPAVIGEQELARQLAPERRLVPAGRPLTLGERKALARTYRREQLLMLLRDPHPAVVGILLDNPHLTESDVVRLAAMRPAVPASLAKIAAHPRWSVRHAVKRALVFNPATPLADAIRIATTLRTGELAELARDPQLPDGLRQHAAELQRSTQRRPRG